MEMLVIIMASLFLVRFPEVNGEYFHSNNMIKKGNLHYVSEEFSVHKAKEYEEDGEKWGLGRIGQEISMLRSQMRSMLQMVELQAVALQTLKDQAVSTATIFQSDTRLKNRMLIGRRYWRKIRKELRSIRECSCRPNGSTISDAETETKNNGNLTAENQLFLETDLKDITSSGNDRVTVEDGRIITHDVGRILGSSDVIQLPGSTARSSQSITKVNPTEIIGNKIRNNTTLSVNDLPSIDDNLESYDVEIDLTTGIVHGKSAAGLTWLLHPSRPKKRNSDWTSQCRLQSVLKLSFSPPTKKTGDLESKKNTGHERRQLLIDLWLHKPHKWIFNLGDSSSNDGLSGDGSTQQNDCEAEGYGDSFNVYKSDKAEDPFDKIAYQKKGFLKHHVTFIVSDQSLFWNNHNGNINTVNDTTLFALNGQSDSQGQVNSDIYLALNRVISGDYRSGHGLCRAALKWIS